MTQWVENPRGGRERGPAGLARAWLEVLVRPRRFFRNGVAPGDQAPGLVFAVAVAGVYVAGSFLVDPTRVPESGVGRSVSAVLAVLAIALLVAPLGLHLVAAVQTLALAALAPDRGGVGETVQIVAYATAPAVFAAAPWPAVRVLAALWGAGLLVVGLAVVHRTTVWRALLAGAVPALLVFGYGFGAVFAFEALAGVRLVGGA